MLNNDQKDASSPSEKSFANRSVIMICMYHVAVPAIVENHAKKM